jgi:hypothetical protein
MKQPNKNKYYSSKLWYHGTSSEYCFEEYGTGTPTGPAYFADSKRYAEFFTTWQSGDDPRIIEYEMIGEPNLFDWNYEFLANLFGLEDIDDIDCIEEHNIAKKVCSLGYDGWVRECDGWEIMLCHPERFLKFIGWVEEADLDD